jgi:hypothetical protein
MLLAPQATPAPTHRLRTTKRTTSRRLGVGADLEQAHAGSAWRQSGGALRLLLGTLAGLFDRPTNLHLAPGD